jgi:uncharacterized metal-binding protein YceD (DUF177 family)
MISKIYNLGRLGQAGDEVTLKANEAERAELAELAKESSVLEVREFSARVRLKKISPTRFDLHYHLQAEIIQACVVTLEPLTAGIEKDFLRELHYAPNLRRVAEKEIVIAPGDDDLPEEIESLHFDLAGPLVEEFLLAIDPYPRAPGVAFEAPEGLNAKPESPFGVLKGLKSGG